MAAGLAAPVVVAAEQSQADLAKAAQNPIANLISLPLQNNTNFDFGPLEKTQNILNIQPVWPFSVGENWNLITRTIIPVTSQPATLPGQDRKNGLGDTTFTGFFSPKTPASGPGASGRWCCFRPPPMNGWDPTSGVWELLWWPLRCLEIGSSVG